MPHQARPHLSHLGIFVWDEERLATFYTGVFGLVVTDRGVGRIFSNRLVFLSANPEQHHQLVLSSGRAPDAPSSVMQMSFMVGSLPELRTLRDRALQHGATNLFGLNHGNSWSVYFDDPEGNRIEIYMDTPFHTPQPCGEPLDLEQDEQALVTATAELVARLPGSMARADYVAKLAEDLAGADQSV